MSQTSPNRHRRMLNNRVYAKPRDPELSKLAMIVGISLLLAVIYVGISSENVAFFDVLR